MKVGICGLGLMGSSVARALVPDCEVLGIDRNPASLELAVDMGVTAVANATDLVDCDLLLLAAPTSVNTKLLADLMASGPHVPTADLGSVKRPIIRQWRRNPAYPFVATHPMAGSERSGAAAGTSDLFRGCAWPVVVEPDTDPAALATVIDLVLMLGARVYPMSAPSHDRTIALASHLPHVLAGALGRVVEDSGAADLVVEVAGGSFRDATRVSASPPHRTAEFVAANAPDAAVAVRAAAAELAEVADLLDSLDSDGVARWLEAGHRVRDDYLNRATDPELERIVGSPAEHRDLLFGIRDSGRAVVGRSPDGLQITSSST